MTGIPSLPNPSDRSSASRASLINGIPDDFVLESFSDFAKQYHAMLKGGASKAKLESFFAEEIAEIKHTYAGYLDNERGRSNLLATRDAALNGDLNKLENEAVLQEVLALASQGDQRAITALAGFGVKSQIYQTSLLLKQQEALEGLAETLGETRYASQELLRTTQVREKILSAQYIIEQEAKRLRGLRLYLDLGEFVSIAEGRAKHMLEDLFFPSVDFEKFYAELENTNNDTLTRSALSVLRSRYPDVKEFSEKQISSVRNSLKVSYNKLGYVTISKKK